MKLLFFLLFLISSSCYSQTNVFEYNLLGTDKSGSTYYIKLDESFPGKCTLWLKTEEKDKSIQVNYMVFYCRKKTYDSLEYVIYNKDGNVSESGNLLQYDLRIFPDTIAENISNYVCPVITIVD